FVQRIDFPAIEPSADFIHQGMFLSRQGLRTLELQTVNLPEIELTLDRIYPDNLFMLFASYYGPSLFDRSSYTGPLMHYLGDRIHEERLALAAPANTAVKTPLKLDKFVPPGERGLFRILATVPGQWEGAQRWVLVTDLGLVARRGEDDLLVSVCSFDDLSPLSGVHCTLLSDQNQVLATGQTDDSGLWQARGLAETFARQTPFMVLARKNDDLAFLLFDAFNMDTTGLDVGGIEVRRNGYTAFLYGERDIYRPGETAHVAVAVRDSRLEPPPALPLTLTHKDPKGRDMGVRTVTTDPQGMVSLDLNLPDWSLTGGHTLSCRVGETLIGTYRFQVEEFVPDRIAVQIVPDKTVVGPGQNLPFTVSSRYFFGPPASGLPVETRVRLSAVPFAPQGFENFSFGNPEARFEDRDIFIGDENTFLDDEGVAAFAAALPDRLVPPAALEAVITARVSERGGRGVAARQEVPVHVYDRYPGLAKLEDQGVKPGQELTVDYVVLDAQGREAPGPVLEALLWQDRWQTVLRRTPSGGSAYDSIRDSRLVSTQALPPGLTRGQVTVVPPEYGGYRIVLRDPVTGATAQASFYASGWGYSPWAIENPARVELVPDKNEYQPGDTARFQVRAPFGGRLLVTVETESVRDVFVHALDGNTAEVEVPVRAEYAPNAYLTAVLVRSARDLEPGGVARASGIQSFSVDRTANRLQPVIQAQKNVLPEARLTVAVTTEPGATVTLAAVDEGILQLVAQESPDPFTFFYAKRKLGVSGCDIFSLLLPEIGPKTGNGPAGGDEALDRMRQFVRTEGIRRTRPVAFWSGLQTADINGTMTFDVDLPEFQGALRLMAVVVHDRRFGSSQALTRVRSPLSVTPTFPRFLAPDERTLIPVVVRNDTESEGNFTVALLTHGPGTVAEANQTVAIGPGREALTMFTLNTGPNEGTLVCRAEAAGQGLSARSESEIGIREALPAATMIQSGAAAEAETLLPFLGNTFLSGSATREVRISPLPLIRFSRSLDHLLCYPYGCAEQTVSRVFPLIHFGDLAAQLAPRAIKGHSPSAMVQTGIMRLVGMQTYEGGFAPWPGSTEPDPWVSIYATHFLLEADRAGYTVFPTVLDQALTWLEGLVRTRETYTPEVLDRACYALFVLAKSGRPERGTMDYLRRRQAPFLGSEAAATLGAAFGLTGDPAGMAELNRLADRAKPRPRETGGNLGSPLRDLSLRLTVLLDVAPGDERIPAMVRDLVTRLDATEIPTTQEAALAFSALGRFYHLQKVKAPYSGRLYAGEALLAEFDSGRTLAIDGIEGDQPLRLAMNRGYESGAAFFSVLTRGIPTRDTYTPSAKGLEIRREFLDRNGAALDTENVRQGDLLIQRVGIRSTLGPVDNVAVQTLLPTGLEVENPRLSTTERLPWISSRASDVSFQDLRDDRIILFVDLPAPIRQNGRAEDAGWKVFHSLLRAVSPGEFTIPPVHAEAMYAPDLVAGGEIDRMRVLPTVTTGTGPEATHGSTD
ncbi:MAG: alpha-2-macroglobulin family protein, partial [Deltaproteobacteria bacterium]|nr:alpha-2-macroglobulin family protein [Deltaproteobacteria bacterium]